MQARDKKKEFDGKTHHHVHHAQLFILFLKKLVMKFKNKKLESYEEQQWTCQIRPEYEY
jgi:hypothetical protein